MIKDSTVSFSKVLQLASLHYPAMYLKLLLQDWYQFLMCESLPSTYMYINATFLIFVSFNRPNGECTQILRNSLHTSTSMCSSYSHYPFSAGLGTLYRPLIPHMLPALVHHTAISAFKGTIKLKSPPPTRGSSWNLNPQYHWTVTVMCKYSGAIFGCDLNPHYHFMTWVYLNFYLSVSHSLNLELPYCDTNKKSNHVMHISACDFMQIERLTISLCWMVINSNLLSYLQWQQMWSGMV